MKIQQMTTTTLPVLKSLADQRAAIGSKIGYDQKAEKKTTSTDA